MVEIYFVNAEKIYLKDEYIYTDDDGRTKRTKERVRRMPPLLKKESLKPQHFKSTKKNTVSVIQICCLYFVGVSCDECQNISTIPDSWKGVI